MNQYITGNTIKKLREKNKLTQLELANKLSVSDKAISKWETGKGYPDITLIEDISKVLNVSITELFSGYSVENSNISSNILKTKFYVCPICGNIITSVGEMIPSCHGLTLTPFEAEDFDDKHNIKIKIVEDEYYVSIEHIMSKCHYISFIAVLSPDRIQLVKLYPEQNAEARFKIKGIKTFYIFCNKDGLFKYNL